MLHLHDGDDTACVHDHTYREGLNVCTQPWNDGHCTPGGLYACELRHLFEWINLYPDITEMAWVDVPADALVAVRLLRQAGANVHALNYQPLRWASYNGHVEVVRLLLEAGANASDDRALRSASHYGHTEVVRLLLQAGANVHAKDDEALRTATTRGLKLLEFN
jgi:Ankyrin repeats (3 copies)